ncbi:MAG TPA: hypothetical protein PK765_02590 [bacterium]|nr:hypothetical protein [bacterium]
MNDLSFLFAFLVLAFACAFAAIPPYIAFLYRHRLGKNIRTEALVGAATEFHKLHKDKAGTPSMGAGVILLVIAGLILVSMSLQWISVTFPDVFGGTLRFSLWNRNETYLAIFTLFAVGAIGLVDDYLNIRGIGRTK